MSEQKSLLSGASHVQAAKKASASRQQVISAVLVGLPAAGHVVTQALPPEVKAYDVE
jgi:hypothetical protein